MPRAKRSPPSVIPEPVSPAPASVQVQERQVSEYARASALMQLDSSVKLNKDLGLLAARVVSELPQDASASDVRSVVKLASEVTHTAQLNARQVLRIERLRVDQPLPSPGSFDATALIDAQIDAIIASVDDVPEDSTIH